MYISKKSIIFVLFIFLLFIVDQISKELVIFYILPGSSIPAVGEFIYLTLVKNQGLVMGFFSDLFYLPIFLIIFLSLIFIFLWLLKTKKKGSIGIAFIIAGTVGNLWDRVFRGGVIDFIDMKFWPIFNLADIFIVIGAVLLCLNLILSRKKCTG